MKPMLHFPWRSASAANAENALIIWLFKGYMQHFTGAYMPKNACFEKMKIDILAIFT